MNEQIQQTHLSESPVPAGDRPTEHPTESMVRDVRCGSVGGERNTLSGLPGGLQFRCTVQPEISENVEEIRNHILDLTSQADNLPRTLEAMPDVKRIRAALNKDFAFMESSRKAAKQAVLAPYNEANARYKEFIETPFAKADAKLKAIIETTEGEAKAALRGELEGYFSELANALGLEFVRFEQCGVEVTLTAAKQKSHHKQKAQINDFLNRVSDDLAFIRTLHYADEITAEYRKCLSVTQAADIVEKRLEELAQVQEIRQNMENAQKGIAEATQRAAEAAGAEIAEEEYTVTFSVTAPRSKLHALVEYLKINGYKWEEVE